MNSFDYRRASTAEEAIGAVAANGTVLFAGGTTLLDLMKLNVLGPARLVDVNALPLAEIEIRDEGLRIGALARMSDVAVHPEVARNYPVIAEALLNSASPQIRNMASIGGNLMQRTRCNYYRDIAWPCNKRQPGSGCAAVDGENRQHAVLGVSESCIATHPSDLAVAFVALDAVVRVSSAKGERVIPLCDFHLLPGRTPHLETALAAEELIVAVDVPASPIAARSHYLKIRDRASYEFALVSVAAALLVESGTVHDCRLALGGVATKPWRVPAAEDALRGQPAARKSYEAAAEIAVQGAQPGERNAFKVELVKRAIVRALTHLGGSS